MDYDADTQDWLDAQSRATPARPPATYGEIMDAAWQGAGQRVVVGPQLPRYQAIDELNDAYRRATGVHPADAAEAAGYAWPQDEPDAQPSIVHMLTSRLPDPQARQVEPYADVQARADQKAAEIDARSTDVSGATYGLAGNSLAYMTGFARQLVDPPTWIGAAVGAPEWGVLRNWVAREAVVNAGFAGAVHPFVQAERASVGLPDDQSLAGDMLAGAAGGVALGGVLRGAGWALGRMFPDRFGASAAKPPDGAIGAAAATPPAPEARPALDAIEPGDFHAAADFVQGRAVLEASAGPRPEDQIALSYHLDDAARRIDAGQPPAEIEAGLAQTGGDTGARPARPELDAGGAALSPASAEAGAASGPAAPAEGETASPLRDAIEQAYYKAAGDRYNARALLSDMRQDLTGFPREDVDAELLKIQSEGGNSLIPMDARWNITPEIEAGGIPVGGETRHILWLSAPLKREDARIEGGVTEPAQQGKGAAAPSPVKPVTIQGLPPEISSALAAQRGEAERALAARPDLQISIPDEHGKFVLRSAREALTEADEHAQAANELAACLAGDFGATETA